MRQRIILLISICLSLGSLGKSGIDAKYKLSRARLQSYSPASVESTGVSFYQSVLSQTLASSCDFYPNDSLKVQIDFRRCSPAYSVFSAMERFYKEPNAAHFGFDIVQIKNKNYFYDRPTECSFWN